ncbi:hypothetical protein SAPIO_CDS4479 [Scedosporium apiospermum]|uniref:Zn(2)-C6 fungal-type domain-containing protein n=1 Tax=Pseudallescheria apiosperma TaxID=563466 RepID=A0A084G897_PSEDA|nr:uncharacterized protein SAPIO_CDS4479 [Scedosporium apiospermum]KEZ43559.1 hypothetical protein SAPIO_CDS4479 [Scedosporium apiospermum]
MPPNHDQTGSCPPMKSMSLPLLRPRVLLAPHVNALDRQVETKTHKRTRASKPKSRSGCLTCKARKVKCDETKPTCTRCAAIQKQCSWPVHCPRPAHPRKSKVEAAHRPLYYLLPRPSPVPPTVVASGSDTGGAGPDWSKTQLPRPLTGLPSLNGTEAVYFSIFRYQVAPELSGYCDTELWSQVVSEGLQDSCVRESILAVGALAKAIFWEGTTTTPQRHTLSATRPPPSVLSPWSAQNIANEHHRASLVHHLNAISAFRVSLGGDGSEDPSRHRKIFAMTLLLIVYEMLQGNLSAADNLVSCGIGTLQRSITLFSGAELATHGLEDVEYVLPQLAVMGLFTHQLKSTWSYVRHLRVEPEFRFPRPTIDPISKAVAYWGRFYTLAVTSLCLTTYDNNFCPFEVSVRRAKFLSCLCRWKSVLEGYLDDPKTSAAGSRTLRLLLLHWQVIWIMVSCCLDPTGVELDGFTAQFRDLLDCCIEFVDQEMTGKAPALMMLGEGVLMPLLCVVTCCRDHDLRMTAAAVAYSLPWREGTWDTKVVLLGQLGAVMMEEKGRGPDGFIPPESRWYPMRPGNL